ncbi:hypothetical protein [Candidatus Pantoea persica]|nr:Hydroxymethylpyrimidine/phosphomethylpyrimidine kinase [Candidatus Pantoea persica]
MTDIVLLLGQDADVLLQHRCMALLRNMQTLYNTGRLAGTGYQRL